LAGEPFRLTGEAAGTDRDRVVAATQPHSGLDPGDRFAWVHWQALQAMLRVSWPEFLEWELWQVAAALGLDDRPRSVEEEELVARFSEASARPPSKDRRG